MTKNSERAIDAKLTRRAFVGAAAATAAVGLAGCAPAATDEAPAKDEDLPVTGEDPYANAEIFYSTCRRSVSTITSRAMWWMASW